MVYKPTNITGGAPACTMVPDDLYLQEPPGPSADQRRRRNLLGTLQVAPKPWSNIGKNQRLDGSKMFKLTGAKRREWMGMGVAGMIIDSYCGSFPHSLLSTSKTNMENNDTYPLVINHGLLENRSSSSMIFPANKTSISTGVCLKPRLFHSNK